MPRIPTVEVNGARIRELRKEAGLSLPDLASLVGGRHPQAIRHVELGTRLPSRVLLGQIADALSRALGRSVPAESLQRQQADAACLS